MMPNRFSIRSYRIFSLPAIIAALMLAACAGSEDKNMATSMRHYLPQQISGWSIQDSVSVYDRTTIFDYINGAGEVFLSYDFQQVGVFQYTKEGAQEITVELFDMGSSEEAYGIFSHGRENEETGLGQGYDLRGNLLCFWKNRYFVCVVADPGANEIVDTVRAFAREIDRLLPTGNGRPRLVDFLPDDGLDSSSVRYFHLHASLNYHYYLADQNILKLGRNTNAVMARYEPEQTRVLVVEYATTDAVNIACDSFLDSYLPEARDSGVARIENGLWVGVKSEGEYLIVVFDAASQEEAKQLIDAVHDKLSRPNG